MTSSISRSSLSQHCSIQIIHSSHIKIPKSGAQKFGNARIIPVHIHPSNPAECLYPNTNSVMSFQFSDRTSALFCDQEFILCLILTQHLSVSHSLLKLFAATPDGSHGIAQPRLQVPVHFPTLQVLQLTRATFIHPAQLNFHNLMYKSRKLFQLLH